MSFRDRLARSALNPGRASPYQGRNSLSERLHMDLPLLTALCLLALAGLFVLYSAGNQSINLLSKQIGHLTLAFFVMIIMAQIPPVKLRLAAPWLFAATLFLLITVLLMGEVGKGAQRWLNLGIIRFQPSELAKISIPMMLAAYLGDKRLPPTLKQLLTCGLLAFVPVILIAKQPDLGTALMIAAAAIFIVFLAGMSWQIILGFVAMIGAATPVIWHFMHSYQRARVLTFINPERDPLGSGYHIIQSKIAIGSGGVFGKGWLHGTQSHLHFLPEHSTDFIFAVIGEELGLIGAALLLGLYLYILIRCLYISAQAQDSFTRLLAGTLSLSFFFAFFVNIGMVTGILPVVGVPLPLISYGGTSIVTSMAGFGILMSIHKHRKLVAM